MKATYFRNTDTLALELSDALIVDTRDLDENTLAGVRRGWSAGCVDH